MCFHYRGHLVKHRTCLMIFLLNFEQLVSTKFSHITSQNPNFALITGVLNMILVEKIFNNFRGHSN